MMLGIHMIGTCEGFAMAQKLGLDPQVFYDIASVSSGQSWSVTSYCPVPGVGPKTPADNGYQGGFATALMLKDLKLAMEAAATANMDPKLGRHAKDLYQSFDEAGNGGLDFSAIIKTV
jgi:3-hydroxyisobutyrate dehydrogenase